ncbi:MAG: HD domain-containing phosphohydrolase [Anaerolineales bacterium]
MSDDELKNAKILIVDDQESNLTLLEGLLKKHGYSNYKSLTDSRQVISTFQEWQPDLILLDLMMPHMDGFAVMEALKPLISPDDYLPILMLTADATAESKKRALSNSAMDFLTKPFDTTEVALRIKNLLHTRFLHSQLQDQNLHLEEKVQERTAELRERDENLQHSNMELKLAYDSTIEGWSHALDLRDKETEGHSQRVTVMTLKLARASGMAEAELVHVRRGALLHDIGKMGVSDQILLKPDKLTDEEWVAMRKHPTFAFELLSPITYIRPALDIPYCHHEKWDGTGYPRGLKGEQIPLAARLFAIVDVWDALHSDRPYRQGWPNEKIINHIKSLSGTHFDPKAVDLFLNMLVELTKDQAE